MLKKEKKKKRFCADPNLTRGGSEIRDGKDL